MSRLSIFLYSFLFILLSLGGGYLALEAYTNITPQTLLASLSRPANQTVGLEATQCSSGSMLGGLPHTDSYLVKLDEYQEVCHSFVTNRWMIFTSLPTSSAEATLLADSLTAELTTFSKAGVEPIVIVEPSTSSGSLVDFGEIKQGLYDKYYNLYFKDIRQKGISTVQMGIWVPFPEPNTPQWNTHGFAPADFSQMVNNYVSALKNYYPTTLVSLLFNSTTYDATDLEYANGEYISFLPWISHINPGLVDIFGIQGFPWLPRTSTGGAGITSADEFLNPRLLLEAADALKVKQVWFNTGTFYAKYTTDSANTVYVSASDRLAVANSIIATVSRVKAKGYSVWVNIFAQDKSETKEATDWSYWKTPSKTDPQQVVFFNLAHGLLSNDIPLSIYDQSTTVPSPSEVGANTSVTISSSNNKTVLQSTSSSTPDLGP